MCLFRPERWLSVRYPKCNQDLFPTDFMTEAPCPTLVEQHLQHLFSLCTYATNSGSGFSFGELYEDI